MKLAFALIASLLLAPSLHAQLKRYPNGLIYSRETIERIRPLVDSINHVFDRTPRRTDYYAPEQALAIVTHVAGPKDMLMLLKSMREKGVAWNILKCTFGVGLAIRSDTAFVDRWVHGNEDDRYGSLHVPGAYYTLDSSLLYSPIIGRELCSRIEFAKNRGVYYCYWLRFAEEFKPRRIPDRYAEMIAYSEALLGRLIDPVSQRRRVALSDAPDSRLAQAIRRYEEATFVPDKPPYSWSFNEQERRVYDNAYERWERRRVNHIDSLSKTKEFITLLHDVVDAVVASEDEIRIELWETPVLEEIGDVVKRTLPPGDVLRYFRRSGTIWIRGCVGTLPAQGLHCWLATTAGRVPDTRAFLQEHMGAVWAQGEGGNPGGREARRRGSYLREVSAVHARIVPLVVSAILLYGKTGSDGEASLWGIGGAAADSELRDTLGRLFLSMARDTTLDPMNRRRAARVLIDFYCVRYTWVEALARIRELADERSGLPIYIRTVMYQTLNEYGGR